MNSSYPPEEMEAIRQYCKWMLIRDSAHEDVDQLEGFNEFCEAVNELTHHGYDFGSAFYIVVDRVING